MNEDAKFQPVAVPAWEYKADWALASIRSWLVVALALQVWNSWLGFLIGMFANSAAIFFAGLWGMWRPNRRPSRRRDNT